MNNEIHRTWWADTRKKIILVKAILVISTFTKPKKKKQKTKGCGSCNGTEREGMKIA